MNPDTITEQNLTKEEIRKLERDLKELKNIKYAMGQYQGERGIDKQIKKAERNLIYAKENKRGTTLVEYYLIEAGVPKPQSERYFCHTDAAANVRGNQVVTNRKWLIQRGWTFKKRAIPTLLKNRTEQEVNEIVNAEEKAGQKLLTKQAERGWRYGQRR